MDLTHFYRCDMEIQDAFGDGERPVQARAVDQVIRGQLLCGFHERSVGGGHCLRYCRFVHSHHHAESAMLFPALRRADPALNPVVDRLEAEHRAVSGRLDEVEAAAQALAGHDEASLRERLATALQELSTDLLEHLQYEEDHISDTLRTWPGWPFW